jgi:GT2 family glycosyltransferase
MCKELNVIYNPENLGYARAAQIGYDSKKSEFSCIINNDVYFSENWLSKMVTIMEEDPSIGMLGPLRPAPWCAYPYKSGFSTDDMIINMPPKLKTVDDEVKHFCMGREYDDFVKDVVKANPFGIRYYSGPPIHIVAYCVLLRSSIIDEVGGLINPVFFAKGSNGTEDTDLSWRVSTAGYKLAITSSVYVHHFKHKSLDTNNVNRSLVFKVSNLLFYDYWKDTITNFFMSEKTKGVDIDYLLNDETNYEYWFLRRLRENVGIEKFDKHIKR